MPPMFAVAPDNGAGAKAWVYRSVAPCFRLVSVSASFLYLMRLVKRMINQMEWGAGVTN